MDDDQKKNKAHDPAIEIRRSGVKVGGYMIPERHPLDVNPSLTFRPMVSAISRSAREKTLDEQIHNLREKVSQQSAELEKHDKVGQLNKTIIASLEQDISELKSKESLRHLLDRVGDIARQTLLLKDGQLKALFDTNETCPAYVVSIDLRRSTELMLKARKPRMFAEFITSLADQLREVILTNYGVFDKFTGDGILAFFPEFFSGETAGLLAVEAAQKCHQLFSDHYARNRQCFTSVLMDTGLGIGVDYGDVSIVQMSGALTVVGAPVVYACRLGGAQAGQTLVNQPAYEELLSRSSEYIDFKESSILVKHEGAMLAYEVRRNEKAIRIVDPEWMSWEAETKDQQTQELATHDAAQPAAANEKNVDEGDSNTNAASPE
ncbi:MAG: adenylate/guanylate cyclase domain-containing protein [Planctomycetaceae bacterium]|nr:adenylate/guanylate cyclase domain-containing protein [Planctomycetaceae bacterium]